EGWWGGVRFEIRARVAKGGRGAARDELGSRRAGEPESPRGARPRRRAAAERESRPERPEEREARPESTRGGWDWGWQDPGRSSWGSAGQRYERRGYDFFFNQLY